MRKHQQRQILDLIQTIWEAQSVQMYENCQECAIVIGEFIESIEGEGTQTVQLLEEYCELLFRACNGEVSIKVLARHLTIVENKIRSELKPNRVEIAFLSYKASMSDSIESIYLAAKADPDCDAYWIPVPYYDLKADGTVGAMHFDGSDCYDNSIYCTNWQDYDIELRHPDVIFTFNPYDAGNYVTSVHPAFYCERLCKLTDMLVYVPYFVSTDDVSEHYCVVAGCVYAHRVIVQSELIRDTYVRVFRETYGNKLGKPEDKFIALGSPKYDKLLSIKHNDIALPYEWQKTISGRKVILYNSSINAILKGNVQYLEKLSHVLDTFRNRKDVVLWWRPHPLNEASYKAMRPLLFDKYKRVIEDYRREDWGIYDDTPHLHRAIVYTDAYYGDPSSLVALYQVTGKPILISDTRFISNELSLHFSGMYVTDESIWFSVRNINAFFKLSRSDYVLNFVGRFPREETSTGLLNPLYFLNIENNGRIYFAPFWAKEIAIYSLCDNTFKKIPFENEVNNNLVSGAFLGAIAYREHVFFTPYAYPAILRLNTETLEIAYYSDWVDPMKNLSDGTCANFFTGFPLVVGNTFWLASSCANVVLAFDMDTCTSTLYEVGSKTHRYNNISFDGQYYWLSPPSNTHTPVLKWNPQDGTVKEFPEVFEYIDYEHNWYESRYCGGYLWLFPVLGKQVLKIDIHFDNISIAEEFQDNDMFDLKFTSFQILGDNIFAYHALKGSIIHYNCVTKERTELNVCYTSEIESQLIPMISDLFITQQRGLGVIAPKALINESSSMRLQDFLTFVPSRIDKSVIDCTTNGYDEAGERIYHYIRNEITTK